jgi:argininosuccinate synthase
LERSAGAIFMATGLHEGQILDPVMRDIEALFEKSQRQVTGDCFCSTHAISIPGDRN